MLKTTDELNNELKEASDVQRFMAENKDEMLSKTIADLLGELLKKKNISKAEVIKKADIPKTYAYELLRGEKEKPSRDKLLRFAFAMQLDLDEVQTLLKHAEMPPLYARNSRDSVIIFAINNKKTLIECNILLEETGKELID